MTIKGACSHRARLIACAGLTAAAPQPISAPPRTFPSADVTIVYGVTGTADPETLLVSPALHLQRVDAPGGALSVVTDRARSRMTVIDRAERTVTVLPAQPQALDPLAGAAGFTRSGEETIAGIPCTDWRLPQPAGDPAGGPTVACLDANGDTLRLASGDLTLVEARSVSHAPLDASAFAEPTDYARAPVHGAP